MFWFIQKFTIKVLSLFHFAVRELSEEEKQMIILSEEFQHFMDRSGRIMERALCESVDIYTDYSGILGDDGLWVLNNIFVFQLYNLLKPRKLSTLAFTVFNILVDSLQNSRQPTPNNQKVYINYFLCHFICHNNFFLHLKWVPKSLILFFPIYSQNLIQCEIFFLF